MGLNTAVLAMLSLLVAKSSLAIPLNVATLGTATKIVGAPFSSADLQLPRSVIVPRDIAKSGLWTIPVPSQLALADGVSLMASEGSWNSPAPPSTCSSSEVASMISIILRGEPNKKDSRGVPEYSSDVIKQGLLKALNDLGSFTVYSKALPFSGATLTVAADFSSVGHIGTRGASQIRSLISDMNVFIDAAVWEIIGNPRTKRVFWLQRCLSKGRETKKQQQGQIEARTKLHEDFNPKLEAGKQINREDVKLCFQKWQTENAALWKEYNGIHCDGFIDDITRPRWKKCRESISKLKTSNARYHNCLVICTMGPGC